MALKMSHCNLYYLKEASPTRQTRGDLFEHECNSDTFKQLWYPMTIGYGHGSKIGTQNGTWQMEPRSKPAVPWWFSFDPYLYGNTSPKEYALT